jgi:hydroxymethylpyrimidine/phosphomethylpyrimidine kinase
VTPPVVLTIAGSDPSAGAGIQADLKTFAAHRVYGVSVITALTTQNSHGVSDVYPVPPSVVATQLDALLDDVRLAAVKVGMLATAETAAVVADRARDGGLPNLVLDPVLLSSSGFPIGVREAVEALLPYATVVTPNAGEAAALLDRPVGTPSELADAAGQLAAKGATYVVVTGGDGPGEDAVDVLWTPDGVRFVTAPRVATRNTHGTGCTFASALAARLALGDSVPDALPEAKNYVTRALRDAADWKLGSGTGPLNHLSI